MRGQKRKARADGGGPAQSASTVAGARATQAVRGHRNCLRDANRPMSGNVLSSDHSSPGLPRSCARLDSGSTLRRAYRRLHAQRLPRAAISNCAPILFMVSLRDIASTRKRIVECSRAIHTGSD
ncbi:hypothetical protein [Burkholderia sp. S-53]|uniref:hypothetical protein n=1 Tax=Burkholderia sp. S-53 TaxID=2906514 RepID=UPI0021D3D56D|nr:hypothetical protein [Burkholderia sp. S-53]UXU91241.1 hypothetical protein LXM88_24015 [Burkholderia sp. S-53]